MTTRTQHILALLARAWRRVSRLLHDAGWEGRGARLAGLCLVAGAAAGTYAATSEMAEYQLKAAYLYNFATFTEWPESGSDTLSLCIYGSDPFGGYIDAFQGKSVNGRALQIERVSSVDNLGDCQAVFIAREVIGNLPRVLETLEGAPVLMVADSPAAAAAGVTMNMLMEQNKVGFEVNLDAARRGGLNVSFQLLRLARKVYQ